MIREQVGKIVRVPEVDFVVDYDTRHLMEPAFEQFTMRHGKEIIGSCSLINLAGNEGATLAFMDVRVDLPKRSRGLGIGAYVTAIERAWDANLVFSTGTSVSESALKIWGVLLTAGVAEVVQPPKYVGLKNDGQRKYSCKIVVPLGGVQENSIDFLEG